jgi:hypothetical protein
MVDGKILNPSRRCSDHSFNSAGTSVLHPGIYPAHRNGELFTPAEWQLFDWRSDWGGAAFEADFESGPKTQKFPLEWRSVRQRIDAATVVAANLKARSAARLRRQALLENGLRVGKLESQRAGALLRVDIEVRAHDGHSFPAGAYLSAPETWADIALIGPDGRCLWRSGGLDAQGRIVPEQLQAFHPEYFESAGAPPRGELLRPADAPAALSAQQAPLLKLERRLAPGSSRRLTWSLPMALIPAGGATLLFRMRSRPTSPQLAAAAGANAELVARLGAEIDDFARRELRVEAQP